MSLEGKIIVTGGAGFIGSALIWALNHRGMDDILVTDVLGSNEKWKNLVPLKFDDYLEADRLEQTLPSLAGQISTIFHLGACSVTTAQDGRYLIENNYEYTKMLAEWALKHQARFVYASSAATYGNGAQGMDDQDERLNRLRPLNLYGYSKHRFDCFAQRRGFLDKVVGLKYFNVFGPNEGHKGDMRSMVHKAYSQIWKTGSVQLFKSDHPDYRDGEQKRDFLYVKDAVAMTIHLAETPTAHGLFNLGSGQANTWLSLIKPLFTALGIPENIQFVPMPEALRQKYQYYTKADTAKLEATGFTGCQFSLKEAVTDYATRYLSTGLHLGD